MAELIEEKFQSYIERELNEDDSVIVASDERHNSMMARTIDASSLCFSIFTERNKVVTQDLYDSISRAYYCLVDTQANQNMIEHYAGLNMNDINLLRVTPFDAQSLPNQSSQLYDTYIGLWIDGLDEIEIREIVNSLFQYIQHKDGYKLKILTKSRDNLTENLIDEVAHLNDLYHQEKKEISDVIEDVIQNKKETIIDVETVPFEEDLVSVISKLRVVVDLSLEPKLFLQICCIGAGIPQINKKRTDYVKHMHNGYIIDDISQTVESLDYFLAHLKNWNYSYAYSMRLTDDFSSINIIHQINQLFKGDVSSGT